MEMMTRRSFLKITGAMALAVGAAGALSGCDAVDNAVGSSTVTRRAMRQTAQALLCMP